MRTMLFVAVLMTGCGPELAASDDGADRRVEVREDALDRGCTAYSYMSHISYGDTMVCGPRPWAEPTRFWFYNPSTMHAWVRLQSGSDDRTLRIEAGEVQWSERRYYGGTLRITPLEWWGIHVKMY